jgi:hypothetical protein
MELQGSGILDVSTFFHHFRSLSGDPFADIRRAVSEYSSVELSLSKKFHSLSVDQIDVLEIDGNRTRFGLYYVAKYVHIPFCNPAAYTQHHDVVATEHSVNSAAHFETADEPFALRLILCLSGAAIY